MYNREFEGGGVIKKQVLPLMLLALYLFQLLNLGYFSIFGQGYFKGGLIFIIVQTLFLIFIYVHYSNNKKRTRLRMIQLEEESGCSHKVSKLIEKLESRRSLNFELVKQSQSSLDATSPEVDPRKSKFMRFVDGNIMKGTERRLTIPNKEFLGTEDQWAMSQDNLRRLRNGYRHPFERIPQEFFLTQHEILNAKNAKLIRRKSTTATNKTLG